MLILVTDVVEEESKELHHYHAEAGENPEAVCLPFWKVTPKNLAGIIWSSVMLFFAHTGITVGLTWLAQGSMARLRVLSIRRSAKLPAEQLCVDSPVEKAMPALNYRLLLVGSMLPDIIDKPLGIWLLRESLSNGRIFSHTLLFAGLLLGGGLYLCLMRRWVGVLCLALGTLAHLILDEMWLTPSTLLWPLYGLNFEKMPVEGWLPRILNSLVMEPTVYLPEIIGAILLAVFFWELVRHGKLTSFLRSGRVESSFGEKADNGRIQ